MATNKVFQAQLYLETNKLAGLVASAKIPAPTATREAHDTISSLGTIMLNAGFEAMEGSFEWKGMDAVIERYTADVNTIWNAQLYFNIEQYAGTTNKVDIPGIYHMRLQFRNPPNADFGAKTDVEGESAFDVHYIRKVIDGVDMYEYDPVNFIYKVRGVDQNPKLRANLGM